METPVEYLDPYGMQPQAESTLRLLRVPIICLSLIFGCSVTAGVVAYRDAARNAASVSSTVPPAAVLKTPGPPSAMLAGDEPIDVETHNYCDYVNRGVETEDGVAAVVERYRCATSTVKLRMNPRSKEPATSWTR